MGSEFPSAAHLLKAFIRPRIYLSMVVTDFSLQAHTNNVKKILPKKVEPNKSTNRTIYEKIACATPRQPPYNAPR
ncbi:MAG TPA: hypothetical protein DIW64_12640 [Cellvibrio sp.]|nr:hypothetical protein [Cellvibrio sp.]